MADSITQLLAEFDALPQAAPLTTKQEIMGWARAAAQGPLFGFADELQALIAGTVSDQYTYDSALNEIQAEQTLFRKAHPYLAPAVSTGTGLFNILGTWGQGLNALRTAVPGARTAGLLLSNPITEGFIQGVGEAEQGESRLWSGTKGGAFGLGARAVGVLAGKPLKRAAEEAEKLKLGAYGITATDWTRWLKKGGKSATKSKILTEDSPFKIIQKAEKDKIIEPGNSVIKNIQGVFNTQDEIGLKIGSIVEDANKKLDPFPDFQTKNAEEYVKSLQGLEREEAADYLAKQRASIISQFENGGSLADIHRAKTGLNTAWDSNINKETLNKAIRADLRAEEIKRVQAFNPKKADEMIALNKEWGDYAELNDAFLRKVGIDNADLAQRLAQSIRTSGGTGSLNIMAAVSGNPLYAIASAGANWMQLPAAKSALSDLAAELHIPAEVLGAALDTVMTGKTGAVLGSASGGFDAIPIGGQSKMDQAYENAFSPDSYHSLFDEFDALPTQKKK